VFTIVIQSVGQVDDGVIVGVTVVVGVGVCDGLNKEQIVLAV
jgi:predicted phosphoribosyltransferase